MLENSLVYFVVEKLPSKYNRHFRKRATSFDHYVIYGYGACYMYIHTYYVEGGREGGRGREREREAYTYN